MQRDRNPRWRRIKSSPFHRIGDTYGHFFNPEHFMGRSAFDGPWMTPEIPSNVKKTQENYEIEMALPGFKKSEISIIIEDELLKVKAQKDEHYKDEFLTKEIHFDSVSRNFRLDADLDLEKIKPVFKNGLLKISIPHNGGTKAGQKRRIKVA